MGYNLYIKNHTVIDYRYFVSPAMTKSRGDFTPLCKIKYNNKNPYIFLKSHEAEVLECLYKKDVFIYDFLEQSSFFVSHKQVLKIPFIRIKVKFQKGFAYLSFFRDDYK